MIKNIRIIIHKFLRHFKIGRFIFKYEAVYYCNKKTYDVETINKYLKKLKKYYKFTDKDIEFVRERIKEE